MSDHFHYEYAEQRHEHRGEYADDRHDHDLEYARKYHEHHDEEGLIAGLREALGRAGERISELEDDLRGALERIRALEEQVPQARQLRLEADHAAADLAESGCRSGGYGPPAGAGRHGLGCQCPWCLDDEPEPEPADDYDPGPEADDEGGMPEYRYALPGDYERGQS